MYALPWLRLGRAGLETLFLTAFFIANEDEKLYSIFLTGLLLMKLIEP